MSSHMRQQVPNALTLLRLVLSIGLFVLLEIGTSEELSAYWLNAAGAVFVAAAVTDWLDGFLARRWGVVSKFGRVMDPFCDKLLILGSLMYFAGPGFMVEGRNITGFSVWMVVLIIARELLVTTMRGLIEAGGASFAAAGAGKAKMVLQSVSVPVILLLIANGNLAEGTWGWWTREVLVWLTVVATALSGLPYIAAFASSGARRIEKSED